MDRHPEDEGLEDEDWDIILEVTTKRWDGTKQKMYGSLDLIIEEGMPKGRVRMFKGRIEPVSSLEDLFTDTASLDDQDDEDDDDYDYDSEDDDEDTLPRTFL
jgi:hypothetical protein